MSCFWALAVRVKQIVAAVSTCWNPKAVMDQVQGTFEDNCAAELSDTNRAILLQGKVAGFAFLEN